MDLELAGRRALVTGGAQGIGAAIATTLAAEGAFVAVADVDLVALRENSRYWTNGQFAPVLINEDLSTADGVTATVDQAVRAFAGPPDILVNNVGVAISRTFENIDDAAWESTFQLNFMSYVRASRALVPLMAKVPGSAVVNISSDLAKQPDSIPADYGSMKSAILYLTKVLAQDYAPAVRTNAVLPGPVWTGLWSRPGGVVDRLSELYSLDRDDALAKYLHDRQLSMGIAEPEDVADLVAFWLRREPDASTAPHSTQGEPSGASYDTTQQTEGVPLKRFEGKTALVTGGTRGIGLAIASRLAEDGASVILTGTNPSVVGEIAERVAVSTGALVTGVACNVAHEASVANLARQVEAEFGTLDILVSNAAIARRNRIEDITLDEWNEVMSTNVTGAFLVTRDVKPLMHSGSSIVIVASQAGKRGEALLSHYASSKAALINMAKSFALEFAPDIRVNAVCPGFIETDMILEHYKVQAEFRGIQPEDVRAEMLARIPLERMQSPESIASVVAFLASEDALDMTGQAINVTGGMVMD